MRCALRNHLNSMFYNFYEIYNFYKVYFLVIIRDNQIS